MLDGGCGAAEHAYELMPDGWDRGSELRARVVDPLVQLEAIRQACRLAGFSGTDVVEDVADMATCALLARSLTADHRLSGTLPQPPTR
jgi:hypothetical protein